MAGRPRYRGVANRTGAVRRDCDGVSVSGDGDMAMAVNRRWLLSAFAMIPFAGLAKSVTIKSPAVKRIYAHAGETITCENGHPICDFRETVYQGDMQNPSDQFWNWKQAPPKLGVIPLPRCEVCNGMWTMGVIYHIGDSWRDPHNYMGRMADEYGAINPIGSAQ